MIVIQDALPLEMAKEIEGAFQTAKYEQYAHANSDYYATGEPYLCRFKRSRELEGKEVFKKISSELCRVMVSAGQSADTVEVFAYRMTDGDFFRSHDDRTNGIGFIYYLCRRWLPDWGGLLVIEGGMTVVPKFNQLVVIDKGAPHFVTPVMDYAREKRNAMVGFIK